jgi:hypothetical protein
MTIEASALLKGAIRAAVGRVCSLILALPIIDPERFSIISWGGWKHIGFVLIATTLVAEAQYWKKWSEIVNGK